MHPAGKEWCRGRDLNPHVHKGHCALNAARLPFRHLGQVEPDWSRATARRSVWWAMEDLNLRPPRCERGALTTELTARRFPLYNNYREIAAGAQP